MFTEALAAAKVPVLDLASRYTELGAALLPIINPQVTAKYGIEISSFVVENVSVPPEVEAAIDKRSSMAAIGNLNDYVKFQMAESLTKEGGAAGGMAGTAAGLGAGLAMGQQMMAAMNQPQATPPARRRCRRRSLRGSRGAHARIARLRRRGQNSGRQRSRCAGHAGKRRSQRQKNRLDLARAQGRPG